MEWKTVSFNLFMNNDIKYLFLKFILRVYGDQEERKLHVDRKENFKLICLPHPLEFVIFRPQKAVMPF